MLALLKYWQIGAGAFIGALLAAGPVYLYGASHGRQQAAVSSLEQSVKILRQRNEIDETVSAAHAAALCGDLGLSDDDKDECMRRVREAIPKH